MTVIDIRRPLVAAIAFERKARTDHLLTGVAKAELKFAEGEEGTFTGYGAVFGNVDSYGDVIQKGAFKDTLRDIKKTGHWPAMLLQHGMGWGSEDLTPIGVWTDLEEDDKGLKVEGKLADTQRGREVLSLMKMTPRPALTGLSIGYRAKEFVIGTKPNEPARLLKKVDLIEISAVTMPANAQARVSAVKAADMTIRQLEERLTRDADLSSQEAKALLAGGFKALKGVRDAAGSEQDLLKVLTQAAERFRA